MRRVFVGFGFGPIQASIFAREARNSGCDVVAVVEIDADLVAAVRGHGDRYMLNVAGPGGVDAVPVDAVRLLNPRDAADRREVAALLGEASLGATALPSVDVYARGGDAAVAALLGAGLAAGDAPATIYTAENRPGASRLLEREVAGRVPAGRRPRPAQFLDTVIGKMSQVVVGGDEIRRRNLAPVAPRFPRAFLVESFHHILAESGRLAGAPLLSALDHKADLLPYQRAKLYGHNAAHALLGFVAEACGLGRMPDLRDRPDILSVARRAMVEESGAALIARHGADTGDPLFTSAGMQAYAEDLLVRMTDPGLGDSVARVVRDRERKLGRSDRLFGAMRFCVDAGIRPEALALGALAGLRGLAGRGAGPETTAALLRRLWGDSVPNDEIAGVAALVDNARPALERLLRPPIHPS